MFSFSASMEVMEPFSSSQISNGNIFSHTASLAINPNEFFPLLATQPFTFLKLTVNTIFKLLREEEVKEERITCIYLINEEWFFLWQYTFTYLPLVCFMLNGSQFSVVSLWWMYGVKWKGRNTPSQFNRHVYYRQTFLNFKEK